MASFGLLEELLNLPDIWYCIGCRNCSQACPTLVKPADLIAHLRLEALRRGKVSFPAYQKFQKLFSRFQRVRWRMASRCLEGETTPFSEEQWQEWLEMPIRMDTLPISGTDPYTGSRGFIGVTNQSGLMGCFGCSECSNACPLKGERSVFDPQWIIRMTSLGQAKTLLRSPTIWLCIECERCAAACSQGVSAHEAIHSLRTLAVEEGFVSQAFRFWFGENEKELYPVLIRKINDIFGFRQPVTETGASG